MSDEDKSNFLPKHKHTHTHNARTNHGERKKAAPETHTHTKKKTIFFFLFVLSFRFPPKKFGLDGQLAEQTTPARLTDFAVVELFLSFYSIFFF